MTRSRKTGASAETVVDDLTLAVGQLIRRLRSEVDSSGLTLSQLSALARLEQNGPMTTAELARAESMKPQSMKTILASLENEGLVQREPHPTDGRQILFLLTRAGVDERQQRTVAKRAWLQAALARLDPEDMHTLAAAIPLIRRLGES
ncbi:MarR family transcriptional regulator [Burkholderia stagnalis]|uniref:MarR family winged helix-turn-helix transcriptional regulator n=1 Tax=Burkholderia stagnalis TaxID=1503054 RepID=UPI00075FF855|nr:MarR family transcriptional regulator [Burkholderia stagnalis]KWK24920.1 MarR family transcriptional regulator [Burkholderia stagnalis]KWK44583.1 MarR family transcriptional regulator [Burkholderia stagnalis]KWK59310.1 MarR family transcriptional regulator [Burkholderia stagnalis]KWN70007.1 MarR family transcriptional regulator [Burkholderia stagnalis]